MIVTLNQNNYKIQTLKGKYAKAIKSTQEKTNSEEMNAILLQNSDLHEEIKQKINDLKDIMGHFAVPRVDPLHQ